MQESYSTTEITRPRKVLARLIHGWSLGISILRGLLSSIIPSTVSNLSLNLTLSPLKYNHQVLLTLALRWRLYHSLPLTPSYSGP